MSMMAEDDFSAAELATVDLLLAPHLILASIPTLTTRR